MTVVCAFRRKRACGQEWKEDGGEVAVAAASTLDSDRVARRELSPVTTTGHAIPSTMSLLDAGELVNVPREFLLSRWENSLQIYPPD